MRLGDMLIDKGLITQDQLRIALMEQKKQNQPLGKILVQIGFISESVMRDALGDQLGQESVDLTKIVPDSEVIAMVPKDHARRYQRVRRRSAPAGCRANAGPPRRRR